MDIEQYIGRGSGQTRIAERVERAVIDGEVEPGDRLPTVRGLAAMLGISPGTAAAAYRMLRQRGVVTTDGRRGTVVAPQPPVVVPPPRVLAPGAHDLASGNPDPALLPALAPALRAIDPTHHLYGEPPALPRLLEAARPRFARDGIEGELAVVGGALDGIERLLAAHLRPGDHVAVEDPCWPRITDLVRSLSLVPEPVAVDDEGPLPGALDRALRRGARAAIVTPRGQNPTGAALTKARARELDMVLERHAEVLAIEDDYVGDVSGTPYLRRRRGSRSWAVVRSLSKVLGPDLRIALVAGDPTSVRRVAGRQLLGPGWVSHLLQRLAVELLLEAGWLVSAGSRYRFESPPGIRITTSRLDPGDAPALADAVSAALRPRSETYAG